MDVNDWAKSINDWHVKAFPWANCADVVRKAKSEVFEVDYAVNSSAPFEEKKVEIGRECSDVLISVLAIMGRWQINVDEALAEKFAEVRRRYPER